MMSGLHLFTALYEHFALQGLDNLDIITVDKEYFKAKLNLSEKETLAAFEEEEEKEITTKCEASVNLSKVAE